MRNVVLSVVWVLACGCMPVQKEVKTVHDVVQLAEDACVIIHDVAPDDPRGKEVCAKEEELKPYINLILAGRAHKTGSDAGVEAGKDAK